jgi:predicted TIM-barrel fold metal-dependent hydrolase
VAEPRARAGRIDVHHHILPEVYVSALASAGVLNAGGIPFPKWDAGSTLEFMDRSGIAAAVVSISAPGVHFGDDAFARDLARRVNDIAAELAREWPARFGAFATLTLPDVDGALRELERALDVLRLDGVVLLSSQSDGRYLGDPAFDPLLAELDRRAALVFVHPTVPVTSQSIRLDLPGPIAEFTFDTTRAAFNLVWTGAAARFPRIRWIFSHAGGTVPFLARRFALVDAFPGMRERAPGGVIAALARFHYDTALSANPGALRSLGELVGPSQVLFGSDHPFAPEPVVAANVRGLDAYDGFDAAARRAIERDNALALLPQLAERLGRP